MTSIAREFLLAVGLLIVLAGVGVTWMLASRPRLTFTAYQQIQAGMSMADVKAILGPGAEGRGVIAVGGEVEGSLKVELLRAPVGSRRWNEDLGRKGTLITTLA